MGKLSQKNVNISKGPIENEEKNKYVSTQSNIDEHFDSWIVLKGEKNVEKSFFFEKKKRGGRNGKR